MTPRSSPRTRSTRLIPRLAELMGTAHGAPRPGAGARRSACRDAKERIRLRRRADATSVTGRRARRAAGRAQHRGARGPARRSRPSGGAVKDLETGLVDFPGRVPGAGGTSRQPVLEARGDRGALLARVRRGLCASGSRCHDLTARGRPLRSLRHPRALPPERLPEIDDQRPQGRPLAPRGSSTRPSGPSRPRSTLRRVRRTRLVLELAGGRAAPERRLTARWRPRSGSACSFGRLGFEPAARREALPTAPRHPHARAVEGGRLPGPSRPAARGARSSRATGWRWCRTSTTRRPPGRCSSARASPISSRPSSSRTRSAGASPSRSSSSWRSTGCGLDAARRALRGGPHRHRRGGRAGRWACGRSGSTGTAERCPRTSSRPTTRFATWRSSGRILGIS